MYELVAHELLENGEFDTARLIAESAVPLKKMRHEAPARYMILEQAIKKRKIDRSNDLYDGKNKKIKRTELAD